MCVTANNAIVNPAGIMIAKPTVKPTTAAGRAVYRPAGSQSGSTKVVQKESIYIIMIKHNINMLEHFFKFRILLFLATPLKISKLGQKRIK